jgi:hypothetical protein
MLIARQIERAAISRHGPVRRGGSARESLRTRAVNPDGTDRHPDRQRNREPERTVPVTTVPVPLQNVKERSTASRKRRRSNAGRYLRNCPPRLEQELLAQLVDTASAPS